MKSLKGFFPGAAAALIMTGLMAVFRLVAQTPSLADLLAAQVITLVPLPSLSFVLTTLESAAKPSLFLATLSVQILVGGLLGLLYNRLVECLHGSPARIDLSGAYGVLLWLGTMLAIMPLLGAGVFGVDASKNPALLAILFLLAFLSYGLSLGLFLRLRDPGRQDVSAASRRDFLRQFAFMAAGVASGGLLGQVVWRYWQSIGSRPATHGQLPPYITPNETFYKVSKGFTDPIFDASKWSLSVTGLVESPLTLSLQQLESRAAVEEVVTLCCISNSVGGNLIGNARWTGVRLRDLLREAGVRPEAREVVFQAEDGYSDSIPIEDARSPDVLLAYLMNGDPLPDGHGAPARLVVPGIYGMKNVKWVTAIEVVDYDYKGYWQRQGWSDEAVVETTSRVDVPEDFGVVGVGPVTIGGIALAGRRGVSRVEVSTDDGATWQEARLYEAQSSYSWVLWDYDWMPARVGRYRIAARATDGTGQLQSAEIRYPLPGGATGLHSIVVTVSL